MEKKVIFSIDHNKGALFSVFNIPSFVICEFIAITAEQTKCETLEGAAFFWKGGG